MSKKLSLVTRLAEPKFKETNLAKDAYMAHIRTFFLPCKHVKPEVPCARVSCLIKESESFDQSILVLSANTLEHSLDPMIFCYTCNRTFHVKCVGLNLDSLNQLRGPFLCSTCKSEPSNEFAVKYYESGDWGTGIEKRRAAFLKSDSIRDNPHLLEEQLTDDDFEREDHESFSSIQGKTDSHFGSVPIEKFQQQQKEIISLGEQYKQYIQTSQQTVEELRQEIKRLQDEMLMHKKAANKEIKSLKEELSKTTFCPNNSLLSSTRVPIDRPVLTAEMILRSIYINDSGQNTIPSTSAVSQQQVRGQNTNPQAGDCGQNTAPPRVTFQDSAAFVSNESNGQELSLTERVLLKSVEAQLESSNAQKAVTKRKSLPKISKYKGDAKGWIRFKQEVQRYRDANCFDETDIKMYILGALDGVAWKRIHDMVDRSSLDDIMKVMETSFGHSPSIIKSCEDDIFNIKLRGDLSRNDVVYINSQIQSYFTACNYANVETLNSNILATQKISQFNSVHKLLFRQHYRAERGNQATPIPDLKVLFTSLEDLAQDLEIKSDDKEVKKFKPAQMNALSSVKSNDSKKRNDNLKSELRDKKSAQYIGYDLDLVKTVEKKCLCCDRSGHFTVECSNYRTLSEAQRLDLITSKNLCRNCLLTTEHQASKCSFKLACGFKIGDTRCAQKHHITFHNVLSNNKNARSNRRSSTSKDTNRGCNTMEVPDASDKDESDQDTSDKDASDKEASDTPSNEGQNQPDPADSGRNVVAYKGFPAPELSDSEDDSDSSLVGSQSQVFKYDVVQLNHIINNRQKSVKIFRNIFFGPHGQTCGYSLGDSGAEITLMRDDLRKQLGLKGEPTLIEMQWTDGSIKKVKAKKVTLEIKGIQKGARKIILRDCYATKVLSLPPRTLDVDKLKSKFPHLRPVDFKSYQDAVPTLLIGTPHAACFESIAPVIENGEGNPIAIKSKIGWSIFGGAPEIYQTFSRPLSADQQISSLPKSVPKKQIKARQRNKSKPLSVTVPPDLPLLTYSKVDKPIDSHETSLPSTTRVLPKQRAKTDVVDKSSDSSLMTLTHSEDTITSSNVDRGEPSRAK